MRRLKVIILFTAIIITNSFHLQHADAAVRYDTAYKDAIFKLVVPTYTTAVVNEDCFLRSEPNVFLKTGHELKKGTVVEVLEDSSEKWYRVESSDEGASGWINVKCIDIREENTVISPEMSKDEVEAFANIMAFPTKSGYFIWTDIARQRTHVFEKSRISGDFILLKTFVCASGKSTTPTTRGFFTVTGRGDWFYSKRFQSGGMYWLRFNGTYLFHSIAMDKNKKVIDGVLGERRSNGCVRLGTSDARWLYENIPDGTSVFIH